jgi:hypothetical protein
MKWKKDCVKHAQTLLDMLSLMNTEDSIRWSPTFQDIQIAISAFLDFGSVEKKSMTLRTEIVEKALSDAIKEKNFTPSRFLQLIDGSYNEIYNKKNATFHVIGSINISDATTLPFTEFKFKNCVINVLGSDLDAKYKNRFSKYDSCKEFPTPCYLCVLVEAKNSSIALRSGLDALDYVRTLINIFNNSSRAIIFSEPVLVNRIQLGYTVTCHNPEGAQCSRERFVNPSAKFATSQNLKNPVVLKENFHKVHNGIAEIKNHDDLTNVVISFGRALDEISPQSSFVLAWGALELLVAPQENNQADKIVSRVSFIFSSFKEESAILQGLRLVRNEMVHRIAGDNDYLNSTYAISYYFTKFLIFLALNENKDFDSVKYLLDCPTGITELEQLIQNYKKALSFRGGI